MKKIILYISAFVPMYILFLINLVIELINNNLTFNILNTCVLCVLSILIMIGLVGIYIVINSNDDNFEEITVVSKQNITDQHFLNYFSLFVLLALAFDLSKFCFVCVFVTILIFIGVVYVKNNIFYVNPLLNIMGYSFYDIEYIDASGKKKQKRIFYKGHLDIEKNIKYRLFSSDKNLNFLSN